MKKHIIFGLITCITLLTACSPKTTVSDEVDLSDTQTTTNLATTTSVDTNNSVDLPQDTNNSVDTATDLQQSHVNIIDEFLKQYDGTQDKFQDTIMTPVNPDFQVYSATYKDLCDMYGEDYFVLFSAEWCPYCQLINGIISNAAVDTNTRVYCIDSTLEPRTSYKLVNDKVIRNIYNPDMESLISLYGSDNFGEKTIKNADETQTYTYPTIYFPSVYHFNNGQVTWVGTDVPDIETDDITDGLNQDEADALYHMYTDFFEND